MPDKQLPYNDPDLKLAQKIGAVREGRTSLSELDDSLIPPLIDHRKWWHQNQPANSTDKQQAWQNIAKATVSSGEKTPIYRLISPKIFRWTAAAILLIGVLFSVFYLQFWEQPVLLAQSGTSIKIVQLDDGSTVTLRPHSKLFAVEQSAAILQYKLKGEAFFEVTPKQHRIFSVKTENGSVSVLGTRFILSSWGNRMRVFLQEGSVKVRSQQKSSAIIIQPGEAVMVTDAGTISYIPNVESEVFTDWLDQKLIFTSTPAGQVVSELEQQFNISITLPETVADNRLTGQFSLESLQISLNDLTLVLDGSLVRTGERSYRFEAK